MNLIYGGRAVTVARQHPPPRSRPAQSAHRDRVCRVDSQPISSSPLVRSVAGHGGDQSAAGDQRLLPQPSVRAAGHDVLATMVALADREQFALAAAADRPRSPATSGPCSGSMRSLAPGSPSWSSRSAGLWGALAAAGCRGANARGAAGRLDPLTVGPGAGDDDRRHVPGALVSQHADHGHRRRWCGYDLDGRGDLPAGRR